MSDFDKDQIAMDRWLGLSISKAACIVGCPGMVGGTYSVQGVDLASKVLRSQANQASVGCAGQTSLIHGGPTSQFRWPKGSPANILVPGTYGTITMSGQWF